RICAPRIIRASEYERVLFRGLPPTRKRRRREESTMVVAKKHSKGKKPRAKFRASWKGQLRFGLVTFEVQAINAEIKEHADIHFHLLHAPDHRRIHYAKICPRHGEVSNDEIVQGYE